MVITRLEEVEKSKVNIYIDGIVRFQLYKKEIENYSILEGIELSPFVYHEILENTIFPRAKQKALAILKFMDRTEQELRMKLKDAGFSEDIIERALIYMKEYDYINDDRYTSHYIRNNVSRKSKLMMQSELYQKGIKKETFLEHYQEELSLLTENEEEPEEPEIIALRKAVSKKYKGELTQIPKEEKQKLMSYLFRKGFTMDHIRKVFSENI
ncbi:MAG: hypothetical protein K0S47_1740 [Herbinix sp.]|jgi:regulatory protein|nr:hypothetical protein [Herbinix sp.]